MPGHSSEEEFDAVYREWYPRLLARASMVCGAQRALASDAVQEAFTQCWRRMDNPDAVPVRNWGTWLATTVLHEAINLCRRHSGTVPLDGLEWPGRGPDLAELMDVKEGFLQVCAVIASLPVRQCEVMALSYLAGLSTAEIADMLRIESSTVRKHRSDARKKLEPLAFKLKQLGLLAGEGGEKQ
ncbi:sigma-70 family RNA polymerase sigma factor [Streptomyces sp. NBC_00638]|uniref:RNA polymerase sigma factor n=1 Tax=Streptomyces sp. NBC_00638 TaxID=2975794 RepID=UPI002252485C|nr:sigma-70 family RNA polymerase sigma factor [Streptomyces sp. NBC_00638]MCX5008940.1 sigma-70 family RNA polymerase sigma factor [Streptomyces sp. NBC_00638]